jgi:hypothetical protein
MVAVDVATMARMVDKVEVPVVCGPEDESLHQISG